MAVLLESTPTAATAAAEPTVLLAIPAGAWRAMVDLAQKTRTNGQTHHHLRAAVHQITQVDSVLHAAVMVDGDEVEVSLYTDASAAGAALTGWLTGRIGVSPGPGLDWRSLRDEGLLPEDMMGSRVVMLPVCLARPGEEGHRR
jgi:hypothetical protein